MNLARRLENTIMERFNNNVREALVYIQDETNKIVHKIHRYEKNPLLNKYTEGWRKILQAYNSAAYAIWYWESVRMEEWDGPN